MKNKALLGALGTAVGLAVHEYDQLQLEAQMKQLELQRRQRGGWFGFFRPPPSKILPFSFARRA